MINRQRSWRAKKSRAAIKGLHERNKLKYREITDRTGKPESHDWELPERIVERVEGDVWSNHLFVDTDGKFQTNLNSWESAVIKAEQTKSGQEIISSFDVNDPDTWERALRLSSNDEVLALYTSLQTI